MEQARYAGAAVATPLNPDLSIDHGALAAHVQSLVANGIDLLTLFGTTGEGASFTVAERDAALAVCSAAGISPDMLGSGIFALTSAEAGASARAALDAGCGHVLVAPPVYYKGPDDEGLYRWFSETIEAVGDAPGDVLLYNIPAMTAIGLSHDLIARLAAAFPGVMAGVKDSSGDWSYTEKLIRDRGALKVFVGHDGQVAKGVETGSSGSIAGSGNLLPKVIHAIVHGGEDHPEIGALIDEVLTYPIIPAVKALIAHRTGVSGWAAVRAPLNSMTQAQVAPLCAHMEKLFPA